MGTGISIIANRVAGKVVWVIDPNEEQLTKSRKFKDAWCEKEREKGRMTPDDKYKFLERFVYSRSLEDLDAVDFVVEAVVEDFDVKKKIFQTLDSVTKPEIVLSSNTSSISLTKIASVTKRPDKVIGMHFMNPVPVMSLVEIVKGLQTSDFTINLTKQ